MARLTLVRADDQLIASASVDKLLDAVIVLTHQIHTSQTRGEAKLAELRAARDAARAEILRRTR